MTRFSQLPFLETGAGSTLRESPAIATRLVINISRNTIFRIDSEFSKNTVQCPVDRSSRLTGAVADADALQVLYHILDERSLHVRRIGHHKVLFARHGIEVDGLIVEDGERHRSTIAYQVDAVLTR